MHEITPGRFDGKVALLTGAGSGIGRASAIRLAAEGAQVFLHDVDPDGLAATADIITEAGGTARCRVGDVTSRDECVATVAAAVDAFGRLDVLCNIAGVAAGAHFTDIAEDAYRRMVAVNMDAPFFLCQAAIPHLLATGGNIGLMGQAYTSVYCMTKGALIQLTRSLAMEYAKTDLRVNAIAPGGIVTNLTHNYQMPADVDFELMQPYFGFRGQGEADDIASLVSFIAAPGATNIHGAVISSDRGITAG
jgi:meso-butanediol dehydrogenase / (S,S)-butanediol dehydrogenase / diacetyl reductase